MESCLTLTNFLLNNVCQNDFTVSFNQTTTLLKISAIVDEHDYRTLMFSRGRVIRALSSLLRNYGFSQSLKVDLHIETK